MDERAIVAVCDGYPDMIAAMRLRINELRLTHLQVDDIAGMQGGYTGKLLCGTRHFGAQSLGQMLAALGLKLVVVRSSSTHSDFSEETLRLQADCRKKLMSERQKKGGLVRGRRMTNEERSASASKAATKRWRDWRALKKQKAERERRAARKKEGK